MAEQEKSAEKAGEKAAPKKKTKRNVPVGKCFIQSNFGNTIVTFTDGAGNALCWSSAGMQGFKGSRKGTPFAAQVAAEDAGRKALENGIKSVDLFINGPGAGREPAVRALANLGIRVTSLRDVTPVPHNGCRPPKRRRI
jgi:small subunit ribosomal protein S11